MPQSPQDFADPFNEDDVPPAFNTSKPQEELTRTSCSYQKVCKIATLTNFEDKRDADKVLDHLIKILDGDNK